MKPMRGVVYIGPCGRGDGSGERRCQGSREKGPRRTRGLQALGTWRWRDKRSSGAATITKVICAA